MARHRKPTKPTPAWARRLHRARARATAPLRGPWLAWLRLWHRTAPSTPVADLVDPVIGTVSMPAPVAAEYTTDIREVAGLDSWPVDAERHRFQEPGSRPPAKPWRPNTGYTGWIPAVPAVDPAADWADPGERLQLIDLGTVRPHRNERSEP